MSAGSTATAAVLAGAALACAWRSMPRPGWSPVPGAPVLRVCAALLAVLSVGYALGLDAWLLQQGRAAAKGAGLYAWRRPLQAVLLLLAGWAGYGAVQRALRLAAAHPGLVPCLMRSHRVCVCAVAAALALFGLRTVSLHGVDAVLDARCFGVGLGRWLEWAAGTVVIASTVRAARPGATEAQTLRAWKPHV